MLQPIQLPDLDASPWVTPSSTHSVVAHLSFGRDVPLDTEVAMLVLRRLVDLRPCLVCGAGALELCRVFGGYPTLMRTHVPRLRMDERQRLSLVRWALTEERAMRPPE